MKGEKKMDIKKNSKKSYSFSFLILFVLIFFVFFGQVFSDDGLGIPARTWGIGFGNLKTFNGLRFNFIDKNIGTINGLNLTLWKPKDSDISGKVNGISLGIIPQAENFNGIQLAIAGIGAKENMRGLTLGLIGAGSGKNMTGINIGGIGVGCGENLTGINIGGIGIGSGKNLTGINFGGLGVGSGKRVTGINLGGLGVGAGETLTGLSIGGLGVGAPNVRGVVIAGLGAGGHNIKGVFLAAGTIRVEDDGIMHGLAISGFNSIKGTQNGLTIGIVNYAYRLKGLQIGLINIVRDNPRGRKVLPIINFNF